MTTIATATLPKNVQYPQYDRSQLRSRIVHFGFGAFHRAHQALLTDRVLNNVGGDWGICEISLFSGDTLMSQLREQDHLFTVLEKGADGNQPIVIGAVHECLNARLDSLAAIIEKFCEPQVAIVSLTITEKGYCIDPADAFLFAQINNGNALSLPFAKGFGWGAELNVRFIFEKAFTGRNGEGYPPERKEPQVRNAGILNQVKAAVVKENYLDTLRAIDPQLVKTAVSGPRFQQCFFENCQDKAIEDFVRQIVA